MPRKKNIDTQTIEELDAIEQESEAQTLPEQAAVFSVSKRFSKLHNLPDAANPPMGYEAGRGYDNVYPFVKLPFLHPADPEDNVTFGFGESGYLDEKNGKHPLNALYFGDNLQILRSLPSNSIDLIYIDPPFFSGRNYNQVWGDDNELRTFSDIWDGGLPTYLIWLNTRLWEMKRVLKPTGSIYVHLDWHASHYVKAEMDKVFGYDSFRNEIVWHYQTYQGQVKSYFPRKHDVILFYTKTNTYDFRLLKDTNVEQVIDFTRWNRYLNERNEITGANYPLTDSRFKGYYDRFVKENHRKPGPDDVILKLEGSTVDSVWNIKAVDPKDLKERIGYPTQKPRALLKRIIEASTKEGDIVADFFMGGGTTMAVAQELGRRFVGSDISRVAVSVTLDRLVRDAEEMSGKKASTSKDRPVQDMLLANRVIPDINVYYHGVYPTDKFGHLSQDSFDTFVLTCFGASKNTVDDGVTGFKTQFEPILVGPASPRDTLTVERVRDYVQAVISKHIQENQRYTLTMIAWKFDPAIQEYRRQLLKTFFKKLKDMGVVLEIELVPIRSKQFRERIATTYGVPEEDKEKLMQFVESPLINEIIVNRIDGKPLTYRFEALAKSLNQGGKLINCQWDFSYDNGNFSDPEYALRRKQIKGNGFEADLIAEKTFAKPGSYTIACKVQDNFGGETIRTMPIEIEK